jgi:hypothetical protein
MQLLVRGEDHDRSKLESPEVEMFDEATDRLRALEYGSGEYKAALVAMGPALTHHYEMNSHHPEHWSGGCRDMSLLDLMEMLCDWHAAGKRHATGSMEKSLEVNRKRFGLSDEMYDILSATALEMGFLSRRCGNCSNLNWPDATGGQCRVYSCPVLKEDAGPLCEPSCSGWRRLTGRLRCEEQQEA